VYREARHHQYCLSYGKRATKIQPVKKLLMILAAVVSIAAVGLFASYVHYLRNERDPCATLTLTGDINSDTFVEARECLVGATAAKKTFVVKASGGGDALAALAIGILIHRHHWDVEIVDGCGSSCANWIFPAGKTKYLNSQSILQFHGGPHQANLMDVPDEPEPGSVVAGAPVDSVVVGHKDKEGVITFHRTSAADKEVLEFLSISNASYLEKLGQFRNASDRFYRELGINPLLPEYGQIGSYEAQYKSYKHEGFVYSLDSLRNFGLRNIELKQGEWHPERHPLYKNLYEVTYP
jgi:hypothetical protein